MDAGPQPRTRSGTRYLYLIKKSEEELARSQGVYNVMEKWTAAMEPRANPSVDVFTWFQHIPSPLAFWKRRAIDAGKTMDGTWGEAHRRVEERRAKGEKRNCIIDALLNDYEKKGWPSSIP
ncbi:hypothetical protein N0V84_009243 [Fusarium piperis]|uniref:Uncharacterized protein n=1 Tax=Fusarium piperis TaxID=1435070 RepID=A0A9W9BKL6_9HYPO|nr:hypothetical protein N0V84_009243 [Fusarium piperis]